VSSARRVGPVPVRDAASTAGSVLGREGKGKTVNFRLKKLPWTHIVDTFLLLGMLFASSSLLGPR